MTFRYTDIAPSTRTTPQTSRPLDRPEMRKNSAGGYTFEVTPWQLLDRFLILGTDAPTYYSSARDLTAAALAGFSVLFETHPAAAVARIREISVSGRAPRNDSALFALAYATCVAQSKKYAFAALPAVARTGTHLFQFMTYAKLFRGRGRSFNRAIRAWLLRKDTPHLAYQMAKYQRRDGMSFRDILRLVKPKPRTPLENALFAWAANKHTLEHGPLPQIIGAMEKARSLTAPNPQLIIDAGLTREMVPSEWLTHASVWEALLHSMPMTAMIRNLGNMSKVGLLAPFSSAVDEVCKRLTDEALLRKARIHPVNILTALKTYSSGTGMRGSGTWEVSAHICMALEEAFHASFQYVEPAGKNTMIALDVSGSMAWNTCGGSPLTPREASAAMAMTSIRTEPNTYTCAFAERFIELPLHPRMNLNQVIAAVSNIPFGGTDCAIPMIKALEHKIPVETFVVYTDNETWAGYTHPFQALLEYREKMGIDARLIVNGMTATKFSIADPSDPGMLDIVGFDSAAPALIADFSRGEHAAPPKEAGENSC